jgi:two-component system sensor histidine kinase QseC
MPDTVSLRRRLTWYVVVILLLMTTASGVMIYLGTTHEADEIFSASLVQTSRILDGLISSADLEAHREQLTRALERGPDAHEYERKLFFAVLDADDQILLHSRQSPDIPHKVINTGFSEFEFDGEKWLTFALESSHDDWLIIVGERSEIRQEITEYIGSGLLFPLILLLPVGLWLLWHIVGVALKPLQHVTDQLRQQNLKELKTIDVDDVPREISPLVSALNRMITDLDSAYARERRFVSDASHELRNPLASLLINVDNAIEESYGRESVEPLQSMKVSIQRLSHLVTQLLELSRFENPLESREFARVDLYQVCSQVVSSLKSQVAARQQKIELQPTEDSCELNGIDSLLTSLVTNLVDNAIKYSGEGCKIRVRCYRDEKSLVLAVDDSGAGLDPGEHEKVLGRFYRAADTNSRGAGLGLSIVKSIAQIHSAQVELGESDLGGLSIKVRFESGE